MGWRLCVVRTSWLGVARITCPRTVCWPLAERSFSRERVSGGHLLVLLRLLTRGHER